MAISDRLIRRLGGELRVRSEVGRGSEFAFSVVLPSSARTLPGTRMSCAGFAGAAVDDNATSLRVTRRMPMAHGMLVCTAGTGQDALDLMHAAAAGDPFDVAPMDHDLPGLDGRQTARQAEAPARPGRAVGAFDCGLLHRPSGACCASPCTHPQPVLTHPGRASGAPPPLLLPRWAVTPTFPGKRVLLVEDNDVNRDVARELLELAGLSGTWRPTARKPPRASTRRTTTPRRPIPTPPVMDGAAKQREPFGVISPIIAMTASALAGQDRQCCLEAGMEMHIRMPYGSGTALGRTGDVAPGAAR